MKITKVEETNLTVGDEWCAFPMTSEQHWVTICKPPVNHARERWGQCEIWQPNHC